MPVYSYIYMHALTLMKVCVCLKIVFSYEYDDTCLYEDVSYM